MATVNWSFPDSEGILESLPTAPASSQVLRDLARIRGEVNDMLDEQLHVRTVSRPQERAMREFIADIVQWGGTNGTWSSHSGWNPVFSQPVNAREGHSEVKDVIILRELENSSRSNRSTGSTRSTRSLYEQMVTSIPQIGGNFA